MAGNGVRIYDLVFRVNADGVDKLSSSLNTASNSAQSLSDSYTNINNTSKTARSAMESIYHGSMSAHKAFIKQANAIDGGGAGGLVGTYAVLAANAYAVASAFRFLSDAFDISSQLDAAVKLTAQTGVGLKQVAEEMKAVTKESIIFSDAMSYAMMSNAAGVSIKQMKDLTQAAFAASKALGVNLDNAMERIFKGAIKAEPELLDELGIILRLDPAVKKYADALNKAESDLSTFEKTQAVVNEVLAKADQNFGLIKDSIQENPYDKLATAVREALLDIANIINSVLAPVADWFSENILAVFGLLIAGLTMLFKSSLPMFENLFSAITNKAVDTYTRIESLNKTYITKFVSPIEYGFARINSLTFADNLNISPEASAQLSNLLNKFDQLVVRGNSASEAMSLITNDLNELEKAGKITALSHAELTAVFRNYSTELDNAINKSRLFANSNNKMLQELGLFLQVINQGVASGLQSLNDKLASVTASTIRLSGAASLGGMVSFSEAIALATRGANDLTNSFTALGYRIYEVAENGERRLTALGNIITMLNNRLTLASRAALVFGAAISSMFKMIPVIGELIIMYEMLKWILGGIAEWLGIVNEKITEAEKELKSFVKVTNDLNNAMELLEKRKMMEASTLDEQKLYRDSEVKIIQSQIGALDGLLEKLKEVKTIGDSLFFASFEMTEEGWRALEEQAERLIELGGDQIEVEEHLASIKAAYADENRSKLIAEITLFQDYQKKVLSIANTKSKLYEDEIEKLKNIKNDYKELLNISGEIPENLKKAFDIELAIKPTISFEDMFDFMTSSLEMQIVFGIDNDQLKKLRELKTTIVDIKSDAKKLAVLSAQMFSDAATDSKKISGVKDELIQLTSLLKEKYKLNIDTASDVKKLDDLNFAILNIGKSLGISRDELLESITDVSSAYDYLYDELEKAGAQLSDYFDPDKINQFDPTAQRASFEELLSFAVKFLNLNDKSIDQIAQAAVMASKYQAVVAHTQRLQADGLKSLADNYKKHIAYLNDIKEIETGLIDLELKKASLRQVSPYDFESALRNRADELALIEEETRLQEKQLKLERDLTLLKEKRLITNLQDELNKLKDQNANAKNDAEIKLIEQQISIIEKYIETLEEVYDKKLQLIDAESGINDALTSTTEMLMQQIDAYIKTGEAQSKIIDYLNKQVDLTGVISKFNEETASASSSVADLKEQIRVTEEYLRLLTNESDIQDELKIKQYERLAEAVGLSTELGMAISRYVEQLKAQLQLEEELATIQLRKELAVAAKDKADELKNANSYLEAQLMLITSANEQEREALRLLLSKKDVYFELLDKGADLNSLLSNINNIIPQSISSDIISLDISDALSSYEDQINAYRDTYEYSRLLSLEENARLSVLNQLKISSSELLKLTEKQREAITAIVQAEKILSKQRKTNELKNKIKDIKYEQELISRRYKVLQLELRLRASGSSLVKEQLAYEQALVDLGITRVELQGELGSLYQKTAEELARLYLMEDAIEEQKLLWNDAANYIRDVLDVVFKRSDEGFKGMLERWKNMLIDNFLNQLTDIILNAFFNNTSENAIDKYINSLKKVFSSFGSTVQKSIADGVSESTCDLINSNGYCALFGDANGEDLVDKLIDGWAKINSTKTDDGTSATSAVDALSSAADEKSFWQKMKAGIGDFWGSMTEVVGGFSPQLGNAMSAIGQGVSSAMSGLGGLLGGVSAAMPYVGAALAVVEALGLFTDEEAPSRGVIESGSISFDPNSGEPFLYGVSAQNNQSFQNDADTYWEQSPFGYVGIRGIHLGNEGQVSNAEWQQWLNTQGKELVQYQVETEEMLFNLANMTVGQAQMLLENNGIAFHGDVELDGGDLEGVFKDLMGVRTRELIRLISQTAGNEEFAGAATLMANVDGADYYNLGMEEMQLFVRGMQTMLSEIGGATKDNVIAVLELAGSSDELRDKFSQFAQEGEPLSYTLIKLTVQLSELNEMFNVMANDTFAATFHGLKQFEAYVGVFGDFEEALKATQFVLENFYSELEQFEYLAQSTANNWATLWDSNKVTAFEFDIDNDGINETIDSFEEWKAIFPKTREEFKELYETLIQSGMGELAGELAALAPQFDSMFTALGDGADSTEEYTNQLKNAQKATDSLISSLDKFIEKINDELRDLGGNANTAVGSDWFNNFYSNLEENLSQFQALNNPDSELFNADEAANLQEQIVDDINSYLEALKDEYETKKELYESELDLIDGIIDQYSTLVDVIEETFKDYSFEFNYDFSGGENVDDFNSILDKWASLQDAPLSNIEDQYDGYQEIIDMAAEYHDLLVEEYQAKLDLYNEITDIIATLVDDANSLLDSLNSNEFSSSDEARNAYLDLVEQINELADSATVSTEQLESLSEELEDLGNQYLEQLEEEYNAKMELLDKIIQQTKTAIKTAEDLLADIDEALNASVDIDLGALKAAYLKAVSEYNSALSSGDFEQIQSAADALNEATNAYLEGLQAAYDAEMQLYEDRKSALEDEIGTLEEFVNKVQEAINEVNKIIDDLWNNKSLTLNYAEQSITYNKDQLLALIDQISSGNLDNIGDLNQYVTGYLEAVSSQFGGTATIEYAEAFTWVQGLLNSLGYTLEDLSNLTEDEYQQMMGQLEDINANLDDLIAEIQSFIEQQNSLVLEPSEALQDDLTNSFEAALIEFVNIAESQIAKPLDDLMVLVTDEFRNALTGLTDWLNTEFKPFFDNRNDELTGLISELDDWYKSALESLNSVISGYVTDLQDYNKSLEETLANFTGEFTEMMAELFDQVIEQMQIATGSYEDAASDVVTPLLPNDVVNQPEPEPEQETSVNDLLVESNNTNINTDSVQINAALQESNNDSVAKLTEINAVDLVKEAKDVITSPIVDAINKLSININNYLNVKPAPVSIQGGSQISYERNEMKAISFELSRIVQNFTDYMSSMKTEVSDIRDSVNEVYSVNNNDIAIQQNQNQGGEVVWLQDVLTNKGVKVLKDSLDYIGEIVNGLVDKLGIQNLIQQVETIYGGSSIINNDTQSATTIATSGSTSITNNAQDIINEQSQSIISQFNNTALALGNAFDPYVESNYQTILSDSGLANALDQLFYAQRDYSSGEISKDEFISIINNTNYANELAGTAIYDLIDRLNELYGQENEQEQYDQQDYYGSSAESMKVSEAYMQELFDFIYSNNINDYKGEEQIEQADLIDDQEDKDSELKDLIKELIFIINTKDQRMRQYVDDVINAINEATESFSTDKIEELIEQLIAIQGY